MSDFIPVDVDPDSCQWSYVSYKEWDTGYEEFGCELMGEDGGCDPENCPLNYKYKIEED